MNPTSAECLPDVDGEPARHASLLTAVLAVSVDPIYVVARDGRYLSVSASGAEALGMTPAQIVGRHWRELGLPADLMEGVDAQREAALHTGRATRHETSFVTPAGPRRFEYVVTPFARNGEALDAVVVVSRDVTERQHREQELADSQERLRLALEAGRMGTWDWDVATNAVRWSPGLEAIHGLSPGTFPGTFEAFQHDMHPDDRERVFASVRTALESDADHHVEYRVVLPDGSQRWVEARGRVQRDETGRPLRMTGVCADVTDRKHAEEQRREESRLTETVYRLGSVLLS
jgi:PAS domain S-box-containing protein